MCSYVYLLCVEDLATVDESESDVSRDVAIVLQIDRRPQRNSVRTEHTIHAIAFNIEDL